AVIGENGPNIAVVFDRGRDHRTNDEAGNNGNAKDRFYGGVHRGCKLSANRRVFANGSSKRFDAVSKFLTQAGEKLTKEWEVRNKPRAVGAIAVRDEVGVDEGDLAGGVGQGGEVGPG